MASNQVTAASIDTPSAPRVSVIMPSYNHARYIRSAIESVLAQTFKDLELLVSDDGSIDDTSNVVAQISDPRLSFVANPFNRGAGIVTNELIARARGEFIALLNSDDEWVADKLERQVRMLDEDPSLAACFTRAQWIDSEGKALGDDQVEYGDVFNKENRSQAMWLRWFFFSGNCLCHPSVLIRKDCYDVLGDYDNRLRQLPDFEMWVRLVKRWPIHIMSERLLRFRILPGENASSPTLKNARRGNNETFFILSKFFDDVSPELLKEGFGDLLRDPNAVGESSIGAEKALLYFSPGLGNPRIYGLVGTAALHRLLGAGVDPSELKQKYGIDDRFFQEVTGDLDTFTNVVTAQPSLLGRLPNSVREGLSPYTARELIVEFAIRVVRRLSGRRT
ncbi:glycosyltransferase family 2 protein [Variovorax guangxiensis]|nr:glycosyltransferase [Variovorax guangxiensis]